MAGMVRHVLDAVGPSGTVSHAALVTGLKHYLGPFEAYATGAVPITPFREEQGRQPVENFYYEQEDRLFEAAQRYGFSWSVHRPAYDHRLCDRQRDEHGRHARGLRDALQAHGPAVRLSGLCSAMEQPDRHDRCAASRAAP